MYSRTRKAVPSCSPAIDQLVTVQIRQTIGVSGVVPVIVSVLRPINAQPSEGDIYDPLIDKPDKRRDSSDFATGGVLLERGLDFRIGECRE
jgi:hypothetical protein